MVESIFITLLAVERKKETTSDMSGGQKKKIGTKILPLLLSVVS